VTSLPRERAAGAPALLPAVAVIAVGGGAGSVLRYEIGRAITPPHDGFPVATLVINLVGALLLGALVVAVTEVWTAHPLVRPALGTGVLGGFTTFSTFAVEVRGAAAAVAWSYLLVSLAGGVLAAALGMWAMRRLPLPRTPAPELIDPDLP
jgi:CrcB protein